MIKASTSATFANATSMTRRVTDSLWFNALWFQSVWFCTVLGRDAWLPVAVLLLAVHVALVRDSVAELRQLACVGGMGIGADALLSATGVYDFPNGVLVPLWLCCLWFAFAAVLGRSLAWLASRRYVAALAGAIAFPLNYWAGQRLGAVEFGYALVSTLTIVGVTWLLLLPQMYRLTRLLDRAGEGGEA